jgi:sigma-B regulation protein RsbU (phosphoserine phosphatase)
MNLGTNENNFTVLVVDDTPTNVLILKKTLLNSGYNVISAENGIIGREMALKEKPDLILLDIMMPEEDGFETLQKLKNTPDTASIPVIFLTALSDVESKVKGFELGAVDYITKPFHPQEIRARTGLHIKLSIATNALVESQREKLKQIETAQQSMLIQPKDMPEAKFYAYYSSLQEAGGDFYDVIQMNENVHCYFVADVSGHDIATSFITASVKALLKQNCSPIYSPTETMKIINQVLLEVLPEDKYLTASYLLLNRKTNKANLINMGHPPIIYHQMANNQPEVIISESDILGGFKEVLYSERIFSVNKGDRIFIYSDGLLENFDEKAIWTNDFSKLLKCIKETKEDELDKAVLKIKDFFTPENGKLDDDVLVLGIEA